MKVVYHSSSMSSNSDQQKDLATPKVPRGLRGLPTATAQPVGSTRDELLELQQDAATIKSWWAQPRWKHTKRVYSGE